MTATPKRIEFVTVGVEYCVQHHGICDVDADVCDFADDQPFPCKLRPLGYRKSAS